MIVIRTHGFADAGGLVVMFVPVTAFVTTGKVLVMRAWDDPQ
jgi:hypothetical protein